MGRIPEQSMSTADKEDRLNQYMKEYRTSLMRMAYLYLGDRATAEDVVQETFIKAYLHMDTFRGDSNEKTWLMRIAINTCKSLKRTLWMRKLREMLPLEAIEDHGAEDAYQDDTVIQAVIQLPEKYKQVVLLKYYQEMKIPEIAEVLGISIPATNSRLNRAKEKLRISLKEWYFDDE